MENNIPFDRNPEMLPSTSEERDMSYKDFTVLWAGMAINMGVFTIGAQLYPGLSPLAIMLGLMVAYLFVTTLLILTGDIGIVYGLPFIVYIRACFGYKGVNFPAVFRMLVCIFWFGFQTWIGAAALNMILGILIGYSNLTLILIIFGALQIWNAAFGVKAMANFDWIAVPVLAILIGSVTFWLMKENNATFYDIFAMSGDGSGSFIIGVVAMIGSWIAMGMNSPDITRKLRHSSDLTKKGFFARNRKAIAAQLIGFVILSAVQLFVGLIGGIFTGEWDPVQIIAGSISSPFILILGMVGLAFAQWSTNTGTNLMPAAYTIMQIFPKINWAKATVIAGFLGLVTMPWLLANNLVWFNVVSSGLMGPVIGIMIADYHLLRKRKLNIEEFYKTDGTGAFKYKNNYNVRGFIAYGISFFISLAFGEYSFFVGFLLSILLYYILMKKVVKVVDKPTYTLNNKLVG
ncbi:cytosine permease [Lentibacillus sp. N15]|uniref:cytosine permease n=1 Tax=Lentibacillus songyuanensis TaxID=3136161 RepID=UPI0031BAA8AE